MSDNSPNQSSDELNPSPGQQAEAEMKSKPPGVLSIFQSVVAAMFGVQSEEKRKQDFEAGHAGNYIFVGVVMVVIFVFTLIYIVNTILEQSAK